MFEARFLFLLQNGCNLITEDDDTPAPSPQQTCVDPALPDNPDKVKDVYLDGDQNSSELSD